MMLKMPNMLMTYEIKRLVKNIVLNSKMKERSKYQLSDNEDLVDQIQLYLKRLVVKIIDSPKYIYEYMQNIILI